MRAENLLPVNSDHADVTTTSGTGVLRIYLRASDVAGALAG
jgi:hypothetical protein